VVQKGVPPAKSKMSAQTQESHLTWEYRQKEFSR
jgi:hypothetical protein